MKRAALYMRVSTLDQHPETQLYDLRQMAEQRGYKIVEEYTDMISSTKARRPGLDAMMRDARRGQFDVVLVWASDRIARSVRHFLELLDELNRLNTEFIVDLPGGRVDPAGHALRFFEVLDGAGEVGDVLGGEGDLLAPLAGAVVIVGGGAELDVVIGARVDAVVEVDELWLVLVDEFLDAGEPVFLEDLRGTAVVHVAGDGRPVEAGLFRVELIVGEAFFWVGEGVVLHAVGGEAEDEVLLAHGGGEFAD